MLSSPLEHERLTTSYNDICEYVSSQNARVDLIRELPGILQAKN